MRHTPEAWLIGALSAFAITSAVAMELDRLDRGIDKSLDPVYAEQPALVLDGVTWFADVRPSCNAVEVETRMSAQPPPASPDGLMYQAACYALAGRTDRARSTVLLLPKELRPAAAGVIFDAGHPAADAGDEMAAGPLMELVVELWPNHAMALYHGGAARYELGDYARAEQYLQRFLSSYATEDGWRSNARAMLGAIAVSR